MTRGACMVWHPFSVPAELVRNLNFRVHAVQRKFDCEFETEIIFVFNYVALAARSGNFDYELKFKFEVDKNSLTLRRNKSMLEIILKSLCTPQIRNFQLQVTARKIIVIGFGGWNRQVCTHRFLRWGSQIRNYIQHKQQHYLEKTGLSAFIKQIDLFFIKQSFA